MLGGKQMLLTKNLTRFFSERTGYVAVVVGTFCCLSVPFGAMQLTTEVNWDVWDFAVMGALLLGVGSIFVFSSHLLPRKYWGALIIGLGLIFLYVWMELAVGIVFGLGS
jgi:hypothetical protein